MDRLKQRLEIVDRALATLEELADLEHPTPVERDAAIQRFEYSFEAVWKAVQRLLHVVEGVAVGSPKGCVRACREAGLLSDEDASSALGMTDDRNDTVHTYNEAVAESIFARLRGHAELLRRWYQSLRARCSSS